MENANIEDDALRNAWDDALRSVEYSHPTGTDWFPYHVGTAGRVSFIDAAQTVTQEADVITKKREERKIAKRAMKAKARSKDEPVKRGLAPGMVICLDFIGEFGAGYRQPGYIRSIDDTGAEIIVCTSWRVNYTSVVPLSSTQIAKKFKLIKLKPEELNRIQIKTDIKGLDTIFKRARVISSESSAEKLGFAKIKRELVKRCTDKKTLRFDIIGSDPAYKCKRTGQHESIIIIKDDKERTLKFISSDIELVDIDIKSYALPKDKTIVVDCEVICKNDRGLSHIKRNEKGVVVAISKHYNPISENEGKKILSIKTTDGHVIKALSSHFKRV